MDSQEESLKLREEFSACQKLLGALGDETRQHLLSIIIMGPSTLRAWLAPTVSHKGEIRD